MSGGMGFVQQAQEPLAAEFKGSALCKSQIDGRNQNNVYTSIGQEENQEHFKRTNTF